MQFQWILHIVTMISVAVSGHTTTVCPVNSQQFISLDRNLLPLENLQASSEGNPAAYLVDPSNAPWCTDRGNGTQPGHHVNLTFTEPVVITMIQSGGFVNGFVNDFVVQYSPSLDGDDFTTYGIIEVPQNFNVTSIDARDVFFTLEVPIVAQRLKLAINGGVLDPFNRLCWEALLMGCILTDSVSVGEEDSEEEETPKPTSCPTPNETPIDISGSENDQQPTICFQSTMPRETSAAAGNSAADATSREELVAIMLPTAVLMILLVSVIVVIGVVICWKIRRNSKFGSKEEGYESVTVKVLDNTQKYNVARHRLSVDLRPMSAVSTISSRDSSASFPGKFLYDVPRPLVYDIPRSSPAPRSRSNTEGTIQELQNTLHNKPNLPPLPPHPFECARSNEHSGTITSNQSSVDADYDLIPDPIKAPTAVNHIYTPVPEEISSSTAVNHIYTPVPEEISSPTSVNHIYIPVPKETSPPPTDNHNMYTPVPKETSPPPLQTGLQPTHVYSEVKKPKQKGIGGKVPVFETLCDNNKHSSSKENK